MQQSGDDDTPTENDSTRPQQPTSASSPQVALDTKKRDDNSSRTTPTSKHALTEPSLPTTIEETPSQAKMANSFGGGGGGGDNGVGADMFMTVDTQGSATQPLDSQIYRSFAEESRAAIAAPHPFSESLEHGPDGLVGYADMDNDRSDIDLVTEYMRNSSPNNLSSMDIEKELVDFSPSTQSQLRSQLSQQSPPRFAYPETPAAAGVKRTYNGEMVSSVTHTSATRTPGSMFGAALADMAAAPGMSLTQIFNNTQAETPNANMSRSDPISQRPSPNFADPTLSSPPMPSSSPTKNTRSDAPRAPEDPREDYTSMKESQERRQRQRRHQKELERVHFDWDEDMQQQSAARRRRKAELQKEGMQGFVSLTAPRRDQGPHWKKKSLMINSDTTHDSPARLVRWHSDNQTTQVELSDSGDDLSHAPPSSSLPGSLQASQHETGVQVPMTSSKTRVRLQRNVGSSPPTSTSSAPGQEEDPVKLVAGSSAELRSSQQRAERLTGTQAVADSQPDQNRNRDDSPPLPDTIPSSLPTIREIPRPSYPGFRSMKIETSILNGSSMPRPPPLSSDPPTDIESHARIQPSSPPLVYSDHSGGEDDGQQDTEVEHEQDDASDSLHVVGKERPAFLPCKTGQDNSSASLDAESHSRSTRARNLRRHKKVIPDSEDAEPVEAMPSASKSSKGANSGSNGTGLHTNGSVAHDSANTNSAAQFHTANTHASASEDVRSAEISRTMEDTVQADPIRRFRSMSAAFRNEPIPNDEVDLDLTDLGLLNEDDQAYLAVMRSPAKPSRPAKKPKTYRGRTSHFLREVEETPKSVEHDARGTKGESNRAVTAPLSRETDRRKSGGYSVTMSHTTPNRPPVSPISSPVATGVALHSDKGSVVSKIEKTKRKAQRSSQPKPPSASRQQEPISPAVDKMDVDDAVAATDIAPPSPADDVGSDVKLTPNRVFARFNGGSGSSMTYWPATCLGFDGKLYTVRFDDGLIDHLESIHIRSFLLRPGDLVKIDLPKMKQSTFTVAGFKDRISQQEVGDTNVFPKTDQYGYRTIVLENKIPPNASRTEEINPATIDVPIECVYVTSSMWTKFRDRVFECPLQPSFGQVSGVKTPSISVPGTPNSRRRPALVGTTATSRGQALTSNLFASMAFAVTLSPSAMSQRDELTTLILEHGGQVLEPGFDVFFHTPEPPLLVPNSNPTKLKSPKTAKVTPKQNPATSTKPEQQTKSHADEIASSDHDFYLKPETSTVGFTALIADRHSRRAKYIQALALGIPCISLRWIYDCISSSRVLPFPRYLLPAGESTFLNGAVRSRTLPKGLEKYHPEQAKLVDVLQSRDKLLQDQNVLLVMGNAKQAEERKKPYVFLSYALGAKNVGRVKSIKSAKLLLETDSSDGGCSWDWIYVDADTLDECERLLFGVSSFASATTSFASSLNATNKSMSKKPAKATKKRKRALLSLVDESGDVTAGETDAESGAAGVPGTSAGSEDVRVGIVRGKKVRIAGDEFVIQSLILGELVGGGE